MLRCLLIVIPVMGFALGPGLSSHLAEGYSPQQGSYSQVGVEDHSPEDPDAHHGDSTELDPPRLEPDPWRGEERCLPGVVRAPLRPPWLPA